MFLLTLNMGSTCYILMLPFGTTGMLTAGNSPRKHEDLILTLRSSAAPDPGSTNPL